MTHKQIERLRKKITAIRKTLAAERRKFGCYDDSRGIRYLPLALYLQLGDYQGGLIYARWFDKTFPDDIGFPLFLFEWTIILFKNGKLRDAERKAFKTFCANTYLFDAFFGRSITHTEIEGFSNWEAPSLADALVYSSKQAELDDFSKWLKEFLVSEKFVTLSKKFLDIHTRLKTEHDIETRSYLTRQSRQLADEI